MPRRPPIIGRPWDVPCTVPIYVFGAGRGGSELVRYLARRPGYRMAAVIDNKRTGSLHGIPIIPPSDLVERKEPGAIVLIASQYVDEIAAQLAASGVESVFNAHPSVLWLIDRALVRRLWAWVAAVAASAAVILAALSGF